MFDLVKVRRVDSSNENGFGWGKKLLKVGKKTFEKWVKNFYEKRNRKEWKSISEVEKKSISSVIDFGKSSKKV